MRKAIAFIGLLLSFWCGAALAAPTDCIGQSADGQAMCVPPEPGTRNVRGCIGTGLAGPTNGFSNCAVANGYPGTTGTDQPLINTYNCVITVFGVPPLTALNWRPEGVTVSHPECWTGTVQYRWGFEVNGYADNYPPGYFGLYSISSRSAACRTGETPVLDGAGQIAYCRPPVSSYGTCAIGNPTQPDAGVKVEQSIDYEGAGAQPLRWERTYRSQWYPRTPGVGLGPNWTHNHAASVALLAGSIHGTRYAYAVRPSGEVHYFARSASSTVWQATSGSRHRLEERLDANGVLIGWSLRVFDDDSSETYDLAGKLLTVAARNGWVTTLAYSDATTPAIVAPVPGLLIAVRNHFGREMRLVYDAQSRIVELLPPGAVAGTGAGSAASPIRYAYDEAASLGAGVPAQGQLTSVIWQDGALRRYHHDSAATALHPSLLTGITDEAGVRYANFGYHAGGKVAYSEHIGGVDRLEFDYGAGNASAPGPNFTSVTVKDFPGGTAQSRSYTFTSVGNARYPSSLSAPCSLCGNTFASQSYDATGQLTKAIAHDGQVSFYKYNAKGQQTERATFDASQQAATTRPALSLALSVTSTKWHATWNFPTQVAEPQKISAFTYGTGGRMTGQSWTATTDATGAAKFTAVKTGSTYATGWSYNSNVLPTTVIEKVDAVETQRWTMGYAANGDLTRVTDVTAGNLIGRVTLYDAQGRVRTGTTTLGLPVAYGYSPRGFVSTRNVNGQTTSFTQNPFGLTTDVLLPDGQTVRFEYDATHRLTATRLNGALLSATAIKAGDHNSPRLAIAYEWFQHAVEALLRPAQAQAAGPVGLLAPRSIAPGMALPGQPNTAAAAVVTGNDYPGERPSGGGLPLFGPSDEATRRLAQAIAKFCQCDPSGGYGSPKLTAQAFAHIAISGHLGPAFANKSYFTEPVSQALVDEVVAKGEITSLPGAKTKIYYVSQIGRVVGQKRAAGGAFLPTFDVTLLVHDDNCNNLFRVRNEVITMFPGSLR